MERTADKAGTRPRHVKPGVRATGGWSPDPLARTRSAKFAALADLLRATPVHVSASLKVLMQPCPGIAACPVSGVDARKAGEEALRWVREGGRMRELSEAHACLFDGSGRPDRELLPDCAEIYLSDGSGAVEQEVERLYLELGFVPSKAGTESPSHIVNELDFVSHLLSRAALGDEAAKQAARHFVCTHLLTWAVVFSAATVTRADNPVTRFAGLMLQHLLFCEAEAH